MTQVVIPDVIESLRSGNLVVRKDAPLPGSVKIEGPLVVGNGCWFPKSALQSLTDSSTAWAGTSSSFLPKYKRARSRWIVIASTRWQKRFESF